jgi:hypothetical protein
MKEEWLMSGAAVPVDVETTAALVAEIHRLIDVVGGLVLKQGPDYERGFVDGMSKQAQSSVDKAVNRMAQPSNGPVAWGFRHHDGAIYDCISPEAHADCEGEYNVPLYDAPPKQEPRNFCSRCGKRTPDPTTIHTCTPPRGLENT